MTGQCGDRVHAGVLPETDLIGHRPARISMGRDDLVRVFRPHEVAHLKAIGSGIVSQGWYYK